MLAVPLLREDKLIGSLVVGRKTPGQFRKETVHLLENLAARFCPGDPQRTSCCRETGLEGCPGWWGYRPRGGSGGRRCHDVSPDSDPWQILAYLCQELTRAERFETYASQPARSASTSITAQGIRTDRYDRIRDRAIGFDVARGLVSVQDRKPQVHEDQGGTMTLRQGHSLLPSDRLDDSQPALVRRSRKIRRLSSSSRRLKSDGSSLSRLPLDTTPNCEPEGRALPRLALYPDMSPCIFGDALARKSRPVPPSCGYWNYQP